ncbi:MAG TPA: hypothetical protein VL979_11430 [Solirubrobacteraceae bacterium]|nr:hypothetical protein [Solirubrobacteraceae bacterium]
MNAFLNSVKADLLDRRLTPLVALVVAALLAAVAYAVLGGGSKPSAPAGSSAAAPAAVPAGIAVSQASSEHAVAETPQGASTQHRGSARNPFKALAGANAAGASSASGASASGSSTTGSSSTGSGSSASSGSGGSSGGSPGSSGSSGSGSSGSSEAGSKKTEEHSSTPKQSGSVYHVAVQFGALPSGSSGEAPTLTAYEDLKLLTPLPSSKQPLIVFRGVTAGGKSATFSLVGEAILHGSATCVPSPEQCQAIDLQKGQSEQLEYLEASGQVVTYELRITDITSAKATGAAVESLLRGRSEAGRELLDRAGLLALPGLRNSSQPGVLVFVEHAAFSARTARARAAARRRHGR